MRKNVDAWGCDARCWYISCGKMELYYGIPIIAKASQRIGYLLYKKDIS